jgi:hypothetical protein
MFLLSERLYWGKLEKESSGITISVLDAGIGGFALSVEQAFTSSSTSWTMTEA